MGGFDLAVLAALLGSGVIGGTFFAFSNFVMKALAQRPPAEGLATMQRINVTVLNPLFLGSFLGTALMCAGLLAAVLWRGGPPAVAAGALLYAIGTFGVTMVCNVPLNQQLAAAPAGDAASLALWTHYLRRWVFWNHVRTVAALLAMLAFAWPRG